MHYNLLLLLVCTYSSSVFLCMPGCNVYVEDNFLESIHSGFVYANLRDNSQVSRLIGKAPLLSELLSNVQYI